MFVPIACAEAPQIDHNMTAVIYKGSVSKDMQRHHGVYSVALELIYVRGEIIPIG